MVVVQINQIIGHGGDKSLANIKLPTILMFAKSAEFDAPNLFLAEYILDLSQPGTRFQNCIGSAAK